MTWGNVTDPDINTLPDLNGLDFYLDSIPFPSVLKGYAGGDFGMLHFNGSNWTIRGSTYFIENIDTFSTYPPAINYGFAIGDTSGAFPIHNRLSLTSDLAEPWKIVHTGNVESTYDDIKYASNDIEFIDGNLAFAVGDRETILRWDSSTANFSVVKHYYTSNYYDIDFYNQTLGFIVGTFGRIVRWDGTGFSDDKQGSSITDNNLRGVKFFDKNFAFAVGDKGTILKWNGNTWSNYTSPVPNTVNLTEIDAVNYTCWVWGLGYVPCYTGAIVGKNGTLLQYASNTKTDVWVSSTKPDTKDLNGIRYYNESFAFAVGDEGKILRNRGVNISAIVGIKSNNWFNDTNAPVGFTKNLNDVIFYNRYAGPDLGLYLAYAIGDSGSMLKWERIEHEAGFWYDFSSNSETNKNLTSIDINNKTFIALGVALPIIYSNGTRDTSNIRIRGDPQIPIYTDLDFSAQSESPSGDSEYCDLGIKFLSNTEAYAVGEGQTICKWVNGSAVQATCQGTDFKGARICCSGNDCNDFSGCGCPRSNAYYSACRLNQSLKATVHAIGYINQSCGLANQSLTEIAQCGGGTYKSSQNASDLKEIYEELAKSILKLGYEAQFLNITGGTNIKTYLYYDSYFEYNYTPIIQPPSIIPVTLETERFYNNKSSGYFNITENENVTDAKVTSYSEEKWTEKVYLNNNLVYNLTEYGTNYPAYGDPYIVQLPVNLINKGQGINGINLVNVSIGSGGFNFGGSPYNKVIYTLGLNLLVDYGGVYATAFGCKWNVTYQDGTIDPNLVIPSTYTGNNYCEYRPHPENGASPYPTRERSLIGAAIDDAISNAVYNLFRQLDFDNDGKLNVKFSQSQLDLTFISVPGIPFMWGPHLVEVRVWQ